MSGLDRETESINFNSMESSSSSHPPALVTIHNLSGNSNLNKKRKYKLVANDDLNATESTPETTKTARSTNISVQITEQKIPDNRLELLKMVNCWSFTNH